MVDGGAGAGICGSYVPTLRACGLTHGVGWDCLLLETHATHRAVEPVLVQRARGEVMPRRRFAFELGVTHGIRNERPDCSLSLPSPKPRNAWKRESVAPIWNGVAHLKKNL